MRGLSSLFRRVLTPATPAALLAGGGSPGLFKTLEQVVEGLKVHGFKADYMSNGVQVFMFDAPASKVSTLSNDRVLIQPGTANYQVLSMPYPNEEKGMIFFGGGGWMLEREIGGIPFEAGSTTEHITISKSMADPLEPKDVEIEALISTFPPRRPAGEGAPFFRLARLESLGRFPLDVLDEITPQAIQAAIIHRYPSLFSGPVLT